MAPKLLKVITGRLLVAINLYQTSAEPALPQAGKPPVVGDEFKRVPPVFTQAVPLVSTIAPVHSSFAGGVMYVMQILKLATVPNPIGLVLKLAIRT